MARIFQNPNELNKYTITNRIFPFDSEVEVNITSGPTNIELQTGSTSYAYIESTLADNDIIEILSSPITINEQAIEQKRINSFSEALLATEIKSMTAEQAVAYIDGYVTNLATAKVVLKIMARLLIAIKNHIWPNL